MSSTLANYIGVLILGGLLGMMGQGVRTIVGLKKSADQAESEDANQYDLFLASRFLVSLFIGFIAGAAAAFFTLNVSDPMTLSGQTLLGLAMAGYAGTDFIEGIVSRFTIANATPDDRPKGEAKDTGNQSDRSSASGTSAVPPASAVADIISNRSQLFESKLTSPAIASRISSVSDTIDQDIVDKCAGFRLRNAADVETVFANHGGFFAWFNAVLANTAAFQHRGNLQNNARINQNFEEFWDQIPTTFGVAQISMIEFCALMSVNIQESSGNLTAAPEEMNGQSGPHPGLAYAFDYIAGLKSSYNVAPNRTALALFTDATWLNSHRRLAGGAAVLSTAGGVDAAWGGTSWPTSYPSTRVDPSINGFVMEADFYKFRGRGIIQTTWRDDYKLLINYILNQPAAVANPNLAAIAAQWRAAAGGLNGDPLLEAIATISTNDDWDLAFAQPLLLAAGVAIDSNAKGQYLKLSQQASVLQSGTSTKGSFLYMARKINAGSYPGTVAPMMQTMLCGVAGLLPSD